MADEEVNGKTNNELNIGKILKDVIQYAIIPLLYIGYTQIDHMIKSNAMTLRDVQVTQVRVIETIRSMQSEIEQHEQNSAKTSADKSRVHHTSYRSCIDCKTRDRYTIDKGKLLMQRDNKAFGEPTK